MTDLSLFTEELEAHINFVKPETVTSKDLLQQIKELGRKKGLVLIECVLQMSPSSLKFYGAHVKAP